MNNGKRQKIHACPTFPRHKSRGSYGALVGYTATFQDSKRRRRKTGEAPWRSTHKKALGHELTRKLERTPASRSKRAPKSTKIPHCVPRNISADARVHKTPTEVTYSRSSALANDARGESIMNLTNVMPLQKQVPHGELDSMNLAPERGQPELGPCHSCKGAS